MLRCTRVRSQLTAWIDGELSPRGSRRVQAHVAGCPSCAAEAESLHAAIAGQRRLLSRLTATEQIDSGALWAAVQRRAAEPGTASRQWLRWRWEGSAWHSLWRPVALGLAAVGLVVVATFTVLGGAQKVLVPLGVTAPPPAVSREPGLFKDYPIIQHLDALENFDTVEAEPLDDTQPAEQG